MSNISVEHYINNLRQGAVALIGDDDGELDRLARRRLELIDELEETGRAIDARLDELEGVER